MHRRDLAELVFFFFQSKASTSLHHLFNIVLCVFDVLPSLSRYNAEFPYYTLFDFRPYTFSLSLFLCSPAPLWFSSLFPFICPAPLSRCLSMCPLSPGLGHWCGGPPTFASWPVCIISHSGLFICDIHFGITHPVCLHHVPAIIGRGIKSLSGQFHSLVLSKKRSCTSLTWHGAKCTRSITDSASAPAAFKTLLSKNSLFTVCWWMKNKNLIIMIYETVCVMVKLVFITNMYKIFHYIFLILSIFACILCFHLKMAKHVFIHFLK